MRKTVLVYGLALAVLTLFLKTIEYKLLLRDWRQEIYIAIIAVLFVVLGLWLGLSLGRSRPDRKDSFEANQKAIEYLDLRPRELEILEAIAAGHSNQQIADRLFISINTVKTHLKNLYQKLDAERRTQALQKARELQLIP
ncbi:response regulator transcription factor [Marinicella sp. W31]|uniref:helix-turn-helix transcriptional regulator n=1 Tax=Marinicella sp. W31 TaxID=3023713 RepID=UPI0037564E60